MNLAEFVSDYLQIDGAEQDSNRNIASAYLEQTAPENVSTAQFMREVDKLAPQIEYYR